MAVKDKQNIMKVCCKKFQDLVFGNMERFFDTLGYQVAKYPFIAILISVLVAGSFMMGIIKHREETDKNELWIPSNSAEYKNNKWLENMFPSKTRIQQYMLVSKNKNNVLTKSNLLMMLDISQNITNVR